MHGPRGYRVSRQAVTACLRPLRPCKAKSACAQPGGFLKHGLPLGTRCETQQARKMWGNLPNNNSRKESELYGYRTVSRM